MKAVVNREGWTKDESDSWWRIYTFKSKEMKKAVTIIDCWVGRGFGFTFHYNSHRYFTLFSLVNYVEDFGLEDVKLFFEKGLGYTPRKMCTLRRFWNKYISDNPSIDLAYEVLEERLKCHKEMDIEKTRI